MKRATKKIVLAAATVLGIVLGCIPSAHAGIALVSNSTNAQCFVNSSCAASYSPTGGNLVIVDVYTGEDSNPPMGCSDNATGGSTTYSVAFTSALVASHYYMMECYTCNVKSGATSITGSGTSFDVMKVYVTEVSGNATTSCLDKVSSINSGVGTTATGGSITPTAAQNEFLNGFYFQNGNTDNFSNSGSWTNTVTSDDGWNGFEVAINNQIVASTSGSYAATAAISGSVAWQAYTTSYLGSGGGGGGSTPGFDKRRKLEKYEQIHFVPGNSAVPHQPAKL